MRAHHRTPDRWGGVGPQKSRALDPEPTGCVLASPTGSAGTVAQGSTSSAGRWDVVLLSHHGRRPRAWRLWRERERRACGVASGAGRAHMRTYSSVQYTEALAEHEGVCIPRLRMSSFRCVSLQLSGASCCSFFVFVCSQTEAPPRPRPDKQPSAQRSPANLRRIASRNDSWGEDRAIKSVAPGQTVKPCKIISVSLE